MSAVGAPSRNSGSAVLLATRWHRPLVWLSITMAVLAVVCLVGIFVDQRILTGVPIWVKPFKFAISVAIYCITLAWLIGMLEKWKRLAWWAGTVAAVFLVVEMVVIVGAVVAGTASHFNVSTPFNTALWTVMGTSIVVVWSAALPIMFILSRAPLGDRARSVAIRAGFVIAIVGMALAALMTFPTAEQTSDFQGIAGAHAVGIPDGGPGLPLVGWSTVAGDLRIPHFVGMHALQVLPLAAILLELAARRFAILRAAVVRARIVWVLVALFVGVLALLTVQALAGQSIVRPDPVTASVAVTLFVGAGVAIAIIVLRGRALHVGLADVDSEASAGSHRAIRFPA